MSGEVTAPAGGAVVTNAALQVSTRFRHDSAIGEITKITVEVLTCRDQAEPAKTAESTQAPSQTMTFSWTTPPFEWNGPFVLKVTATGRRGPLNQTSTIVHPFSMEVSPIAPGGLKSSASGDTVSLAWNKNPEPDLVLYEVGRAAANETSFVTIAQTTASLTSLTDKPGKGDWRYRVVAIRRGAEDDVGVRSDGATTSVEVGSSPSTTEPSGGGSSGGTAPPATSQPSGSTGASTAAAAPPSSKVDLSNFEALLNSRNRPAPQRIEPPDPGFAETLPFQAQDEESLGDESQRELGSDEPNQGAGQKPITDDGDRRRSMAFVAGGLIIFVIAMIGLWVNGEVKRADELEVIDTTAAAHAEPEPEPEPLREPGYVPPRRQRRAHPPLDSPGLDVPLQPPTNRTTSRPRYGNRRVPAGRS